jgi:hypothetical protein
LTGSARKASIEPYSSGSNCAHRPDGERKSGIPLSVEQPAPVRTTHGWWLADELGECLGAHGLRS